MALAQPFWQFCKTKQYPARIGTFLRLHPPLRHQPRDGTTAVGTICFDCFLGTSDKTHRHITLVLKTDDTQLSKPRLNGPQTFLRFPCQFLYTKILLEFNIFFWNPALYLQRQQWPLALYVNVAVKNVKTTQ